MTAVPLTTGGSTANDVVTFNSAQFYTGTTTVNGDELILNGGNNTLVVVPTASTLAPANVALNGTASILELNGNSQVIGTLLSSNPLPGMGGTVQNSSGTTVTLTEVNNGNSTFGGAIDGNLNFNKYGNSTLILASPNTYTGTTIVGGGTLTLRDQGTLATSAIQVNYSTLTIDNTGLNPAAGVPTRFPATAPVTLQGGTINFYGGGSVDTNVTINSLTALDGENIINMQPPINQGSTLVLNIGNLSLPTNYGTINFNGFVGTFPEGPAVPIELARAASLLASIRWARPI